MQSPCVLSNASQNCVGGAERKIFSNIIRGCPVLSLKRDKLLKLVMKAKQHE